ncbi:flagellar hook capping FlgD N-terminal domain-containing protein [Roseivivax sediminis]|uniref:Basal-body rod modification protein FlgD n=1 Tax=Roseivivax sediminis TaxID=936889 RepID=A0A1I1U7Z1_9RHOB|nr:flagellar hook capping FlgD N-terminal domain-containing protein [Roseivivax sediminis]SFD66991.1 flagellar basal-body rod modification protein FlgD [Roseivivax sediminis]
MNEVTALSAGATGAATDTGGPRRAALASDFDTFLRMLTVQARNQDPLNPLDATDYASQLATFSNVEQQVVANELLTQIASAVGGSALDSLRAWVGADVLAKVPTRVDGGPVVVHTEAEAGATAARLVVTDASGTVVSHQSFDPAARRVTWDATDSLGQPVVQGTYSFSVESFEGDKRIATSDAAVYARVIEARFGADGESELVLGDGTELPESAVLGMRVAS